MTRREQEELVVGELARVDNRRDALALFEREQVADEGTARLARAQRKLVYLEAVALALVREEHHVVVEATKSCSTKSFSLSLTPLIPLPPRFCWR